MARCVEGRDGDVFANGEFATVRGRFSDGFTIYAADYGGRGEFLDLRGTMSAE